MQNFTKLSPISHCLQEGLPLIEAPQAPYKIVQTPGVDVHAADGGAVYAPVLPGHPPSLLFVHDGALIAQAFDWRRLELSGERKIVVPEVRQQRWQQSRFSVSSSGVLLYQGAQHQQLSWFDRQGKLLATVGPPNDCLSFVLSPDERYVALHRHDDPDTVLHTIWVMDLLREGAVFRFTDADLGEPQIHSGLVAR